jgi:tetratricopeptide (TPR) repeat protein/HEAT repeat protein
MTKTFSLTIAIVLVGATIYPLGLRAQANAYNADEEAIKKVVVRFLVAYQKKDLDGVMACWSTRSPHCAVFKQRMQNEFEVWNEASFANLTFTDWKINTDTALVRLRYDRQFRVEGEAQADQKEVVTDVQLVKELGDWKFWSQSDPEAELVLKLFLAGTKEERTELLKAGKEWVTADLVGTIGAVIERRAGRRQFDDAQKLNEIAFEIAEMLGGAFTEGQCYFFRGIIFHRQLNRPSALEDYRRALRLFQEARDKRWEAAAFDYTGDVLKEMGRYQESLAEYEESRKLLHELGEVRAEVRALIKLGIVHRFAGKYADALAQYESILKIAGDLGDNAGVAGTLLEMGIVYSLMGRNADALARFEECLKLTRETENKIEEAQALNNIGAVYRTTGEYAEALAKFEDSLQIARRNGNKPSEATVLHNIGLIYSATGKYPEALAKFEESLDIKRSIGDQEGFAMTLNSVGNVYQYTGRYDEALKHLEASLKIKRAMGNRLGEGKTLGNIGVVYQLTGRTTEALENFKDGLEIMREMGDRAGEAVMLGGVGVALSLRGDHTDALKRFEESLPILREVEDRVGEARLMMNMGEIYRYQGRWQLAADAYRKSISLIEMTRTRTKEPSLLDRELRSWRRFKHLRLGVDRLKVFEAHPTMVATDRDALTVLLLSSLKHKGQADIWITRIALLPAATQDSIARQLFDYFHNRDRLQRRDAAEAIAALDPACLLRALSSASAFQKKAALEMLGGIELREAAPDIVALLDDPDQQIRVLACGALGEIQGAVAVKALKSAAGGIDRAVAAAAILALGRTDSSEATAVIKDALSSQTGGMVRVATTALAASRHPVHVQHLLLDPSVGVRARQAIWKAVKRSPHTLVPPICEILHSLPDAILQEASQSPHDNMKHAALSRLSRQGGKAATNASRQLSTDFVSWNESADAAAKKQVDALLVETADLPLLSGKFKDIYFRRAAAKRLANGSQEMGRLIERLLKSGDELMESEAYRAVYSSTRVVEIPERTMLGGLTDLDPTVRYFACLAASRQTNPALAEVISGLIDDAAKADRYRINLGFISGVSTKLGECVSDAAHYALDRLNPRSKVWRKRFQRTFME